MQKEGLALTEKKKAILLTNEKHNAERVYDDSIISKLNECYDLYETVICKNNIKKAFKCLQECRIYIFYMGNGTF